MQLVHGIDQPTPSIDSALSSRIDGQHFRGVPLLRAMSANRLLCAVTTRRVCHFVGGFASNPRTDSGWKIMGCSIMAIPRHARRRTRRRIPIHRHSGTVSRRIPRQLHTLRMATSNILDNIDSFAPM